MRPLSLPPQPNRWPAFVRPKPDELLSSWLLRNAHAHNTKAHTFCRIVWPKLSFWNRDIDRMALPQVYETIALKTGVSNERSYQTTLAAYENRLFKHHTYQGNTRWIMPLGIYHRERKGYGIQYCPLCLKTDKEQPYYRRWWRLSLAVACPFCGVELKDACPICHRAVVFHRSEVGRKNELATHSLSHCSYCQADLSTAETHPVPAALQNHLLQYYNRINTAEPEPNAYEHFDVLHHLVFMVSSRRPRLIRFQRTLCQKMNLPHQIPAGGFTNSFERLRISGRTHYLMQANWLMDEWPTRFINVARESGTWSSFIIGDGLHLPVWFLGLVNRELTGVMQLD